MYTSNFLRNKKSMFSTKNQSFSIVRNLKEYKHFETKKGISLETKFETINNYDRLVYTDFFIFYT